MIDDPIIVAYKRLGVESIAAALRTMRYAVGPRRKILAVNKLISIYNTFSLVMQGENR